MISLGFTPVLFLRGLCASAVQPVGMKLDMANPVACEANYRCVLWAVVGQSN